MRPHSGIMAVAVAILICGSGAAEAQERCFEPLADPSSRDPRNFKDLELLKPTNPARGVERFLTLDTGRGPANIDFYHITFTAPAGKTVPEFFKMIRIAFPEFVEGKSRLYAFGPYDESTRPDDPVGRANLAKWKSDNPQGALMSFNLGSLRPSATRFLGPAHPGRGVGITEEAGDVQVICASPTDFIFATVFTKEGYWHPVAGYRAFGLKSDPNGQTWTFYSKAVDRDSGYPANAMVRSWYNGNGVFCLGHIFWISFFGEIRSFLQARGLKVTEPNLTNHGPVPYPFPSGSQPALKCQ